MVWSKFYIMDVGSLSENRAFLLDLKSPIEY